MYEIFLWCRPRFFKACCVYLQCLWFMTLFNVYWGNFGLCFGLSVVFSGTTVVFQMRTRVYLRFIQILIKSIFIIVSSLYLSFAYLHTRPAPKEGGHTFCFANGRASALLILLLFEP